MSDLVRDSVFGQLVRLATGGKVFQYPDEYDESLREKYINKEKSANLAVYGSLSAPQEADEKELDSPSSGSSSRQDLDKDAEKDPEKQGDLQQPQQPQRSTSQTSPPATRVTSRGSNPIGRLHSAEPRPNPLQRTSSGNSFLNELRERESRQSRQVDRVNTASGTRVDPEKGRDIHLVDWYGPDDPENPQNWSRPKKFWVTFEICILTFSVYVGSAIYTAGIVDIMQTFNVSRVAATLGLTLFVIGYALGPMLWAPMSEIPQIGRGPVYIGTLAVFVVLQVPTALASNFGMLLAFRFLTGFIGSPSLATGGASIADMYSPAKRTYGIAIWGIGAVLGPTMGPLLGGFAAMEEGWEWPIWILMMMSGGTLVVLFFLMPETSSANILYRRTRRLRKQTGNDKLRCEPELIGETMTGKDLVLMVLVRPFTLSFLEPICFFLNMYIALVYAITYIWFESFPIVFIEIYHFNNGTLGLAFIGILVGVMVVFPCFAWYFHKYTEPRFNEKGDLQPEYRLPPAFVGAFCIPICLFWFGWASRESVHWIVPIIGTSFFGIGAFLLFMSVLNYLGDAYPLYAASVLAGNDLFRSAFGAAFPLFATAMYENLGVGWASSLLGFLSITFIPIPFLLFKYGVPLRRRSKRARQE